MFEKPAEHPVVQVHPETGEGARCWRTKMRSFVGLVSHESGCYSKCCNGESPCLKAPSALELGAGRRSRWDNRAATPGDRLTDDNRLMHRVTLMGDVPRRRVRAG